MKIIVLASGSSGNATYIIGESAKILIDAGIKYKMMTSRLNQVGIEKIDADALFITHEHGDHVGGLASVITKLNIPYYINEKSFMALNGMVYQNVKEMKHIFISPFDKIRINDMVIEVFELSHDSRMCLGFLITEYDKKIVYVADTGYFSMEYNELLGDANCYLFEANHDPTLQMESNRELRLKQRVLGIRGHLSNEDSAVALSYLITQRTKNIIFLHRSKDCNSLDLLKDTIFNVFNEYSVVVSDIEFDYAEQHTPTRIIEV